MILAPIKTKAEYDRVNDRRINLLLRLQDGGLAADEHMELEYLEKQVSEWVNRHAPLPSDRKDQ